jgi:Icc-related predicted phosphoesterase
MILAPDILYILLNYCDPIDTNIICVIGALTENENVFDKFIKFSVYKTHRIKIGEEYHKHIIKKERQNQLKQFQNMKTGDTNPAPFYCDTHLDTKAIYDNDNDNYHNDNDNDNKIDNINYAPFPYDNNNKTANINYNVAINYTPFY